MSTIALQSTFEPARDRLMSLHCSHKLTLPLKAGQPVAGEL
jgi:hypothetical protein